MQSVENKIEKTIKSKPKGFLLFPEDFSHMGSAESVRKALQSLKEKGLIKSVSHGIYVRPKTNEFIGELLPSAEDVAQAIAKRDKIRLVPTGSYALNALGLSTQVPLKLVFLTDGAARTIEVGKRTIKLKRTTPKNIMAKGKISALVIQALREIGKDRATSAELDKIIKLLKEEDPKDLLYDIALAPEWIKKIMKQATNE
jgi:predicted transcriptional regulator